LSNVISASGWLLKRKKKASYNVDVVIHNNTFLATNNLLYFCTFFFGYATISHGKEWLETVL